MSRISVAGLARSRTKHFFEDEHVAFFESGKMPFQICVSRALW